MRRNAFQAIAGTARRVLIGLIALNTLAEQFDTSRQAVFRHLRILTECQCKAGGSEQRNLLSTRSQ